MSSFVRCVVLLVSLCLPLAVFASEPAREKTISLRVQLDAAGKVQSAQPLPDPEAVEALTRIAVGLAPKLPFTPAKKDGVAVASETTLYLKLVMEPKADGQFGVRLAQASNGPHVVKMGRLRPPENKGLRGSALVVVSLVLRADGTPDMSGIKTEKVEMSGASAFAEARYMDTIVASLNDSRFELDKVGGVAVPTRVSLPYQFGGSRNRDSYRDRGRKELGQAEEKTDVGSTTPSIQESSEQPGVELPKVVFAAAK